MANQSLRQRVTAPRGRRPRPHAWALLLLLPAVLLTLTFDYWPLMRTFVLAFQATDLFGDPSGFIGFKNFEEMFASPSFWQTFGNSMAFAAGSVVAKLVAGLALAVPLSYRLRGTQFLRPIVLVPMAISAAVAGVVFQAIYRPVTGLLDQVFGGIGLDTPGWLTDPNFAMVSVVIADTWTGIGFVSLLLMAALDGVPDEVLEAARVDGAGPLRIVGSISLPLITPTLFFIVVTQSIAGLREFGLINVLTGGGPAGSTTTFPIGIYIKAFGSGTSDYGAAAAQSLVLLLLVLILSFIQFRVIERRVHY